MNDSALQDRLTRIEQRQYLILVLLVVPYLLGIAQLLGFYVAGVLYTVCGLVAFVSLVIYRRRRRNTAEQ